MIVQPSDFKGMIVIPQVGSAINTGVDTILPVNDVLNELITDKEPAVLSELLGFNFYRLFRDGLAVLPTPEQRWIDLRDGMEWQDGLGNYHKFKGVKPLIARYVYYWYLRQEATQTTGIGEAVNNAENARRTSPIQKQVTAWNEMVELVKSTYYYLNNNEGIYPEWHTHPYMDYDNQWDSFFYCGFWWRCRKSNLLTPINTFNL